MKNFFKRNLSNCIIYICAICLSFVCMLICFLLPKISNDLKNVLIAIGTSLFSGAFLAFSIELSNYKRLEKIINDVRANKLSSLNDDFASISKSFCTMVFRLQNKFFLYEKNATVQEKTLSEWLESAKDLFQYIEANRERRDFIPQLPFCYKLINDTFLTHFNSVQHDISLLTPHFDFWEHENYFTENELKTLKYISTFDTKTNWPYYLLENDFCEFYNELKENFFESIFQIPEFQYLKDLKIAIELQKAR